MPAPTPPPPSNRRLIAVLVAMAVAGIVIGWLVRGDGRDRATAGRRVDGHDRPVRSAGPAAPGRWTAPRRTPSAADVLGALRAGSGALVTVEGRVIDAVTRDGVGDVEVVFAGAAGEVTTVADAAGVYRIQVEPGAYRAFVRGDGVISVGAAPYQRLPSPPQPDQVAAPDDALATIVDVRAPQRGVDLEVQPAGLVVGRVVDRSGRPVVGAIVRADRGLWQPVLGTHVAETDAAGAFQLEVPAGFYELDAAHPDFAGPALDGGRRTQITVYPSMETDVELELVSGCVITGRAVRADGTPAGAGAIERGRGGDFWPAGQLADDGTFRFTTVVEEEVTLRAWPWKSPPAAAKTFACRDGARHVVEFVLPDDGPDLTGTIVDAHGAPVPGAYVDVYGVTPGTMNQQERADADGAWAVYALPDGEYAVTAYVPGGGVATARVTVPGSGVVLRLSGTGAIAGRVDGVPDGGTFQLDIGGCVSRDAHVVMPASRRVVPVDGGRFRIDGLPACELYAVARGAQREAVVRIAVEPGATADVHLDLAPPRAKTVRVSVVDEAGDAVAGAHVVVMHLEAGSSPDGPVATDGRGLATVEAHVGDQLSVYFEASPGAPLAYGGHVVSDAPGTVEDAEIRVTQSP